MARAQPRRSSAGIDSDPARGPLLEDIAMGFCAAGAAIAVTDARMRILVVNAAYATMTGCAPAELIGRHMAFGDGTLPPTANGEAHASAGCPDARQDGEVCLLHRDGHTVPVWRSIGTVRDAQGRVKRHVVTCTDISALKRERDALRHQAQHDALTGLPQRAVFEVALQQSIAAARRHGRRFALLFVDIDRFKYVNDTLGHRTGDQLLQDIGQRLRRCVRGEDLVARLGGDEFTVLLQDVVHPLDLIGPAELVLDAIGRRLETGGGHAVHVTGSVGIALFPGDADNAADLIQAADAAMYAAKKTGGGRFAWAVPPGPQRT